MSRTLLNIKTLLAVKAGFLLKFLLWFLFSLFFLYNPLYQHFQELPAFVPENFYETPFFAYNLLIRSLQQNFPKSFFLVLVLQNLLAFFAVLLTACLFAPTRFIKTFVLLLLFPPFLVADISLLPFSFVNSLLLLSSVSLFLFKKHRKIRFLLASSLLFSLALLLLPVYFPVVFLFIYFTWQPNKKHLAIAWGLPIITALFSLIFPPQNLSPVEKDFSEHFPYEKKQLEKLYSLLGKTPRNADMKKFGRGKVIFTLPQGLENPKKIREEIKLLQGFALCIAEEGKNLCRYEFRNRIRKILTSLESVRAPEIPQKFFPEFLIKLPLPLQMFLQLSFFLLFFTTLFKLIRRKKIPLFSLLLLVCSLIFAVSFYRYNTFFYEGSFPLSALFFITIFSEYFK